MSVVFHGPCFTCQISVASQSASRFGRNPAVQSVTGTSRWGLRRRQDPKLHTGPVWSTSDTPAASYAAIFCVCHPSFVFPFVSAQLWQSFPMFAIVFTTWGVAASFLLLGWQEASLIGTSKWQKLSLDEGVVQTLAACRPKTDWRFSGTFIYWLWGFTGFIFRSVYLFKCISRTGFIMHEGLALGLVCAEVHFLTPWCKRRDSCCCKLLVIWLRGFQAWRRSLSQGLRSFCPVLVMLGRHMDVWERL